MTDPRDFEPRLADALRRYSDRAPIDVDAMALAREIASAPTKASRLHPRWWPFGRNHPEQRRSRTMLITTSAVALAAVALLGATLGLPALVADPDEAAIQAPAAAGVGDDWAFFSGTLRFDGTNDGYAEVQAINGLTVQTGEAWVDQTLTASDPRMTGTRAEVDNTYQNLSGENGGSSGAIWASMVTIEANGGRWSCQLDGLSVGSSSSESGWCEGLDGFAGLSAFVAFDIGDASGNDQIDVSGYITNGDGPPVPAPTTD